MVTVGVDPLRTPGTIAFAGDWHGNTRWACRAIEHAALLGADVILHCGDYGYDFELPYVESVEQTLVKHGLVLMFVDGNHENFDWLLAQPLNEQGLRPISKHVFHIPRGYKWIWDDIIFMGLGGAVSVDRRWRKPGIEYWWQEEITDADVERACEDGPVDIMITHDSPLLPESSNKGTDTYWPKEEMEASQANQDRLNAVVQAVNPKLLVHGHHHCRHSHTASSGLRIEGLDCDGRFIDDNIFVCGLQELKDLCTDE